MSCKETQTLLDGYLDGELDVVRSIEIEGHLQDCPDCAQLLESQQALRSAIRGGSLYFKAPAQLQKRIQVAVRQASKAEPRAAAASSRAVPWRFSWQMLGVAAAVAIAVVLTWSVVTIFFGSSAEELVAQEVVSSHVRALQVTHLTDVLSSDQHLVKPWFAGKLEFSPPVKDLASEAFPLVGGRLDYLANRPVAALIYQRRQHYINVFVWFSPQTRDKPERAATRQGFNLFHWTKAGMTYWVVSDLNASELQEFTRLLQN